MADRPVIAPRAPSRRPKHLWIKLHLYLGLTLGALFAVLGLTGSLGVYRDEIDRLIHPAYYAPDGNMPAMRFADLIERGRSAVGKDASFTTVEVPASYPGTAIIAYQLRSGTVREAYMDRSEGRLMGVRTDGESLSDIALEIHESLLIHAFGPRVSGVIGMFLFISILSGVYIWWPRRSFSDGFRVHFRGNRRRMYFELHRAMGGAGAAVLLVSCLTGFFQAFPEPLLAVAGSSDVAPATPRSVAQPVTIDAAIAAAEREFPGAAIRHVGLLGEPPTTIRVIMRSADEPTWRGGESRIWIDLTSGAIERTRGSRTNTVPQEVLDWLPAIHTGDALGWFGRALMFVAGLLPAAMFYTGLRLWILRRPSTAR